HIPASLRPAPPVTSCPAKSSWSRAIHLLLTPSDRSLKLRQQPRMPQEWHSPATRRSSDLSIGCPVKTKNPQPNRMRKSLTGSLKVPRQPQMNYSWVKPANQRLNPPLIGCPAKTRRSRRKNLLLTLPNDSPKLRQQPKMP